MIEGLTGIASLEAEMRDRLADKNREIESLRSQLAAAQAKLAKFDNCRSKIDCLSRGEDAS